MKIALTGTSSTGKTTLAQTLLKDPRFTKHADKLLGIDARRIIESYNCKNIDEMSRAQLCNFELDYFANKKQLESQEVNFLTERSFVDVAAFWAVRDTYDQPPEVQRKLLEPCKIESATYDLTVYLPFGLLPFEADGYRSENIDFHENVDRKILALLDEWEIRYIKLDFVDLKLRIEKTIREIQEIEKNIE